MAKGTPNSYFLVRAACSHPSPAPIDSSRPAASACLSETIKRVFRGFVTMMVRFAAFLCTSYHLATTQLYDIHSDLALPSLFVLATPPFVHNTALQSRQSPLLCAVRYRHYVALDRRCLPDLGMCHDIAYFVALPLFAGLGTYPSFITTPTIHLRYIRTGVHYYPSPRFFRR
ncbi:hypothetical protein BOTBODRAFT_52582 [Botryobasidium botryosum FD-172 SS1]|uniref:Uncharacterized protein n=1 Tax=Botryobasidium botryosum (strain FD-172 SS1) TaxID=930990 RepID=A0A067MS99_BOTB1|nr:hypothetical protein BOTBODRAFT_52582 [Botryobasidium botryosum FD-172 SS1]